MPADGSSDDAEYSVVVGPEPVVPTWHPDYVPPEPRHDPPTWWYPEAGEPPDDGPPGGVREPRRPSPPVPGSAAVLREDEE